MTGGKVGVCGLQDGSDFSLTQGFSYYQADVADEAVLTKVIDDFAQAQSGVDVVNA